MEILAFHVGQNIVGILDLNTDRYTPHRGSRMVCGARRLIDCEEMIVSFNGNRYDLPMLAKLVRESELIKFSIRGKHFDMLEIASCDRCPPDPG